MCILDANCFRSIRLHQSQPDLETFRPVGLTNRVIVYAFYLRITKDIDADNMRRTTQVHAYRSVLRLVFPNMQTPHRLIVLMWYIADAHMNNVP
jgi:hypothetical protein